MMESPCVPPCPPGPTSLPLSPAKPPQPSQEIRDLIELSPDSGNGEELDEFDPLKSPVRVAERRDITEEGAETTEKNYSRNNTALEVQDQNNGNTSDELKNETRDRLSSETKPNPFKFNTDFNADFNAEFSTETPTNFSSENMQITPQSDSGSNEDQGRDFSSPFNFSALESSLLSTCNPSFQCGPFTGTCGTAAGRFTQCHDTKGPFSLPEGDPILDAGTYNAPYLLGADGSTAIRPFSMANGSRIYPGSLRSCAPVGIQQPSNPTRNPSYPRCLRGRPTRRYTNHDVVRKQPTAGLMNTEELLSSSPAPCPCVNQGTHAGRVSEPMGVLNPMFEPETTNVTYSMPLSPRKFSMDHGLGGRVLEFTGAPPIKSLSQCYQQPLVDSRTSINPQPLSTNMSLPNPQAHSRRGSDCASISSATHKCQCQDHNRKHSSTSLPEHMNGEIPQGIPMDLYQCQPCQTEKICSHKNFSKPQVTSPDWFSLITPSKDSYTQRLFTPDDLHEELLYPAPYGLKSEIYQNMNAREADFVLQKPNRKPRTEPLPSSCLQTNTKRSVSPEVKEGIIQPLATEDEEAQIEGARESRKVSLKDRRKSSLEKIYIPKPVEPKDPILNVKIDNFDRDEYVKYKKSFGENEPLVPDFLELTKKDSCSSISSSSDGKSSGRDSSKNSSKNSNITSPKKPLSNIDFPAKNEDKLKLGTNYKMDSPTSFGAKINSLDFPAKNEDKMKLGMTYKMDSPTSFGAKIDSIDFPAKNGDKMKLGMGYTKNSPTSLGGKMDNIWVSGKHEYLLQDLKPRRRRPGVFPVPKQRSLEEQPNPPSVDISSRKQSLPTEDLFGHRRPHSHRKTSLAPLTDSRFHISNLKTFSPVSEADEISSKFPDNTKRKPSAIYSPKTRAKKNARERQTDHPRERHERTKTQAKHMKEERSHHHHHHHHHHELKSRQKPNTRDTELRHKSGLHSSPRKPRRQVVESHTNRRAQLSPPGPYATGDLFTRQGGDLDERLSAQRGHTVPYEPLVDALTPTTPELPLAASGATRKKQQRKRRKHNPLHHHYEDDEDDPLSSSSPPPISKSSSSSSTLTSSSGGSHKRYSSADSSSSSGTDSSSSSSSSSESSSSSSDSSDIEDLIL